LPHRSFRAKAGAFWPNGNSFIRIDKVEDKVEEPPSLGATASQAKFLGLVANSVRVVRGEEFSSFSSFASCEKSVSAAILSHPW
jgi:hypothetical protein